MKKKVIFCMAITALLLCSCGTADMFVATPVPGVGSVVVASTPVTSTVGVVTPAGTVVYSTPRAYVTYPYGYTYYRPNYTYRRLPPPPPPRKRRYRR